MISKSRFSEAVHTNTTKKKFLPFLRAYHHWEWNEDGLCFKKVRRQKIWFLIFANYKDFQILKYVKQQKLVLPRDGLSRTALWGQWGTLLSHQPGETRASGPLRGLRGDAVTKPWP